MFLRRTRGLLDLCIASLCLWGACYHTPVGAGLRGLAGLTFGFKSSSRPLLAYYNGGVYGPSDLARGTSSTPTLALRGPVPPDDALGFGLYAAFEQLSEERRGRFRILAAAHGVTPFQLSDSRLGPRASAKLVRTLAGQLGSEEAAVLALFCGLEPARYAQERARAEGGTPSLEKLVRQLPPGFDEDVLAASNALMYGTAYALAWPAPLNAPITSPFGMRMHPVLGQQRMHTGVDIGLREGTPVRAVADGRIVRASEDAVNGRVLTVDHGRGVTTSYCHNSTLLGTEGEMVVKGQVIANSGNTGRSTGPHLHYQLELGRVPADPLRFRASASGSTGVASEAGR